ncbi:helix-turn-helix domain-containing protein [Saccharopolyspora spinosporotrichia]
MGAKLWMLRDAAGLTRKKAAAKAGVKEWSIASVETRRTVPHADWLAALLDVYRASDAERAEVEALYHAAGGRSGAGTETTAEPETGSNPPEYKWLTGKKLADTRAMLGERVLNRLAEVEPEGGVNRRDENEAARQEWISAYYAGQQLTGAQLGERYNKDGRWGSARAAEARRRIEDSRREADERQREAASREAPGLASELLGELDSLRAMADPGSDMRSRLDLVRAQVIEQLDLGLLRDSDLQEHLDVVRGLAQQVRAESGGAGSSGGDTADSLNAVELLADAESARIALEAGARQWGEAAMAQWFAYADSVLGSMSASDPFRVLMAHHFMQNPWDLDGAQQLRARLMGYMARGVYAGAGPEPGGDADSRSPDETSEEVAHEQGRQEMLARLERLAGSAVDGVELGTIPEEPESGAETASRRVSWPGVLTSEQRSTEDSAAAVTADSADGATADAGGIAAMDGESRLGVSSRSRARCRPASGRARSRLMRAGSRRMGRR